VSASGSKTDRAAALGVKFFALAFFAVMVIILCLLCGYTIIQGRVVPYPAWYWSKEANYQRECLKGLHNSPYRMNPTQWDMSGAGLTNLTLGDPGPTPFITNLTIGPNPKP